MTSKFPLETIVSWAKRKWFVYPNSDIYGWLANSWDYGPYGAVLKKNIADLRVQHFTSNRDDVVYMDTAIIAHPTTWVASGHVGSFADALIDDKNTGQRFRADKIIEHRIEALFSDMINKPFDVIKFLKDYGQDRIHQMNFLTSKIWEIKDEIEQMSQSFEYYNNFWNASHQIKTIKLTNNMDGVWSMKKEEIDTQREYEKSQLDIVMSILKEIENKNYEDWIKLRYWVPNLSPESWGNDGMYNFITKFIPNNPDTGAAADWTECRNFNLMLDTHLWPVADDANKVYMRPETCQSLFTDFKMVTDTTRNRIPFGLAQIGKAFRNEITPGQFLFRTREFEQMEIEYFIPAESKLEDPEARRQENITNSQPFFEQWKADSWEYWTQVLGINPEHLRFKDHDKLAHYAAAATDVEYAFPWGFWEVQWVHNRTNFDLQQHQEHSKTSMQYVDPRSGARYVPRCIEASWGLGRQTMVAMLEFYDEEILDKWDGQTDTRIVVRFPFALAPVKFAVLPLLAKSDEMCEIARKTQKLLRQAGYVCEYDESGGIGKRYRRQDEIGTPYCITIDHQTLEDGTYTVRDRDTMWQLGTDGRMSIEDIAMLEYNLWDNDCEADCDFEDCDTSAAPIQGKVCCGGGCGCH